MAHSNEQYSIEALCSIKSVFKIKVLQDFFKIHSGNVIFIDTDTLVLSDLDEIFKEVDKGFFYMRANKYKTSSQLDKRFYHFLNRDDNTIKYNIPIDSYMNNSGIIGMN